jgi:hypothetical protein
MSSEPLRELVHRDSNGRNFVIESFGSERRMRSDDRPAPPRSILGAIIRALIGRS